MRSNPNNQPATSSNDTAANQKALEPLNSAYQSLVSQITQSVKSNDITLTKSLIEKLEALKGQLQRLAGQSHPLDTNELTKLKRDITAMENDLVKQVMANLPSPPQPDPKRWQKELTGLKRQFNALETLYAKPQTKIDEKAKIITDMLILCNASVAPAKTLFAQERNNAVNTTKAAWHKKIETYAVAVANSKYTFAKEKIVLLTNEEERKKLSGAEFETLTNKVADYLQDAHRWLLVPGISKNTPNIPLLKEYNQLKEELEVAKDLRRLEAQYQQKK